MNALGKLLVTGIVVLIAGLFTWRYWDKMFPKEKPTIQPVNMAEMQNALKNPNANVATPASAPTLLAGDKEAKLVTATEIPKVSGISDYTKSMKNGKILVKFPINVWPGWSPIIVANNGLQPNDDSIFFKKYGFYLELSIVDDPVKARDLYASGNTHILWGTLDMMTIFAPELCKDSRISPVIPMQIDWSNGGDGIVARNGVRSINDLGSLSPSGNKRKVVSTQNSPSHYFSFAMLIEAGVQPSSVEFCWAADAPSAAKIFVQDKSVDAFVGWAPDIYVVPELDKNAKVIMSTGTANHWIADVFAVRNDFATDHPEIVDGLVDGILEGMEMVRADIKKAATLMAAAYSLPLADAEAMIGKDGGIVNGDAHLTNYRENENFFMNAANPNNFEAVWMKASLIYKSIGTITEIVPASKVKYTKTLVGLADKWKDSTDLSQRNFTPKDINSIGELDESKLVKSVSIKFRPGKCDLDATYDTEIPAVLKDIGQLASGFGAAIISIEGNADASQKGVVPADAVKRLSQDRADAVKNSLVTQYKMVPERFRVIGHGWDNPLPGCTNPNDKEQNRKNRRVEIKVYPLETE